MFSCFKPRAKKPLQALKWCPFMNDIGINIIIIKKGKTHYKILDCVLSESVELRTYINRSLDELKYSGIRALLLCLLQNEKDLEDVLDVFQHNKEKWQGRVYLHFENDDKSFSKRTLQYIENMQKCGDGRIAGILRCKTTDLDCHAEHKKMVLEILVKEIDKDIFIIILKDITQHFETERALVEMVQSQLDIMCESMPRHVVEFLMTKKSTEIPAHMQSLTRCHSNVTIMFLDIVGFTVIAKRIGSKNVIMMLNHFFTTLDRMTDRHDVCKVETAGDCYIVSSGVTKNSTEHMYDDVESQTRHAKNIIAFSNDALCAARETIISSSFDKEYLSVRIGIHTGDIVSGMIGQKLPKFSLFGDTMNIASRMEKCGKPNRIHVSQDTYALLPEEEWEYTGGVFVKGCGQMDTYLLVHRQKDDIISPTNSLTQKSTFFKWIDTVQHSQRLSRFRSSPDKKTRM